MSDGEGAPPDREPPRRWTRRVAPLLLVGGILVAGAVAFRGLPKERQVELRLEDPTSIVAIDVAWIEPGDETTLGGSSFRFAPGAAPRSVPMTARLPDGTYTLEITVDSAAGHQTTRRSIKFDDAGRITVPVR
jgi:hypothetical protein